MGKQTPNGEIVSGDNWTFQLFADRVLKEEGKKKAHICAILMHHLEGLSLPHYLENAF